MISVSDVKNKPSALGMTIVFFDAYKNTYSKPASTSMKNLWQLDLLTSHPPSTARELRIRMGELLLWCVTLPMVSCPCSVLSLTMHLSQL